ncbi:serine/threonine-protein kinase [Nocardia caishijiensis]|uniref:non-specific serine/threonine protein kinase n=1 Tax=Nocardia caishijiensis TaxID=184756 RepID=A0ABQ6YJ15_9NOCA|nr:serine/threonine-protein kinase [Nocardia caishijiensis]KAF0845787.1 serine/threonine-protein kinase [Nocardia caishijiensis]
MSEQLRPGAVFAGYVIERVLGSGGMGTVYAARHPRLPRSDALKVLSDAHSASAEFRARFVREAELAARIDHPNVVAVHDRGIDQGALWIAMQYVAGTDAASVLRDGVPDPRLTLHIVAGAAAGLDAAHRAGLLHRDVKPANLMLESRVGEPERVLVADFGIAKSGTDGTALTESGVFLATLAYAAPELIRLDAVDHRADQYSLGCTLYELLTGRKPFPRETPAAVINAHLTAPPPRPTELNPHLPPAVDAVIARALAKNPDDRYASCGALAAATAAAFGTPVPPTARIGAPEAVLPRNPPSGRPSASPGVAVSSAAPGTPHGGQGHRPDAPGDARAQVVPRVAQSVSGGPRGAEQPWATPRISPAGDPPRRRWPLVAGAAVLVTAAAIAAGIVALNRDEPTTPEVAATSAAPTTAAESPWKAHEYIVRAFPELLPKSPFASGYQGTRCAAIDKEYNPVPLDQLGDMGTLSCNGDRNPVERMTVACKGNRAPGTAGSFDDALTTREEQWERPSGRGRIVIEDIPGRVPGTVAGALSIQFDDTARNFCLIVVLGGANGTDLYNRWWVNAPL